MVHDLMYKFNKIAGFGNAKEIIQCFKKALHLSNTIDMIFMKVSTAFIFREEQYEHGLVMF